MEEKIFGEKVSLINLFLTFAKIGVMTFGGGMAMLPILTREITEKREWASLSELTDYYAVALCTPGIIAVNTATFIGHRKRGIPGGIVATLGVVFPSIVIIVSLASIISIFSDNIYVQKAFMGIRICVCVLIINSIIKLWKSAIKGKATFLLFLVACLLSMFFDISPEIIILISISVGVVCSALRVNLIGVYDD